MAIVDSAAAFDFARRLREPGFRAYLVAFGYISGTTVLAVENGTTTERLAELAADRRGEAVLVARRDPRAPHGWRLSLLDPDGTERP